MLSDREQKEIDRITTLAYRGGPGCPESDVRWLLWLVKRQEEEIDHLAGEVDYLTNG